jgi:RNA polymerase sigma factor (sigma-70 family)
MEMWPATTRGGEALKRGNYPSVRRLTTPLAPRGEPLLRRAPAAPPSPNWGSAVETGGESVDSVVRADPLVELAAAAKAGDEVAIRRLILRMKASTALIVRNVLGYSHSSVDDVIQEATISQVTSLKNFRGDSTVAHFANNVTLRVALSARRRINRRRERNDSISFESLPDVDPQTPLSLAIDQRTREAIVRVLRELPPKIAEVLTLHMMLGYSTGELARMQHVSKATIRSLVRAGKQEFRRLMRRERRTGRVV